MNQEEKILAKIDALQVSVKRLTLLSTSTLALLLVVCVASLGGEAIELAFFAVFVGLFMIGIGVLFVGTCKFRNKQFSEMKKKSDDSAAS